MPKYIIFTFVLFILIFATPAPAAAQAWTLKPSGVTNELNDMACVDERTCYVVGGAPFIGGPGIVIKTTDGGEIWTQQTIPTTNPLRGVSCPTSTTCYAAGDGGVILKTTDGGTTWVRQSVPNLSTFPGQAQPWFWDIWAPTTTTAVAVGNVGAVYRTINGGSTWTQMVLGLENYNLTGIFFANETTGWLTGAAGLIHRTTNAGATWIGYSAHSGTPALSFSDVFSLDGETVWASGPFTFVIKSLNGGVSWTESRILDAGGVPNIEFVDNMNGWIAVNGGIEKTTNGGASWTQEALPRLLYYRSIQCIGPSLCYAVGDDGIILRRGTPPPPSQADLAIGDRTLTCPAGELGLEFAEYRYSIVVRNTGNADAGPFTVRLQGLDASGNPVGTPVNAIVTGLADGESATITGQVNVGLLNPTATATATVRITADILGQVAESNEANNTEAMTQTCATATPKTTIDTDKTTAEKSTTAQPTNRPPNLPVALAQRENIGLADQPAGWTAPGRLVAFKAEISDPDTADNVGLDIEVKLIGTAFTGTPTFAAIMSPNPITTQRGELLDPGSYHWRVRTKDSNGAVSAWVSFGGNAESVSDFAILPPISEIQPPIPPPSPEPAPANKEAAPVEEPLKGIVPVTPTEPTKVTEPARPTVSTSPTLTFKEKVALEQKITEERSEQIEKITLDAPKILGGFSAVVEEKQIARDTIKEQLAHEKVEVIAKVVLPTVAVEKREAVEEAMKAFIAYGAPTRAEVLEKPIEKLGAGERAGVVNSFKEAFGKLPETNKDWEDVMKIAIGRFPSQTNPEREKAAEAIFKKVYLRNPVRTQTNDNACVTVISYGLRPDKRNLNSEKVAIQTFRKIFKKGPSSASEWDTVRCIGYSGAKR